jgi:MFS family permease
VEEQLATRTQIRDVSETAKKSEQPLAGGYAKYVVAVLVCCYTLAFIDRQILSLLIGPIKHDLHISDTRFGLLSGLAFALFYTLMGLPIGRLVDTRNRRNIVVFGVAVWSVMTSLCSAARTFTTLFLARMGVGVGEATLSPAAFSIISDYFPKEQLGLALSTYSMGIFIGSGLAFLVGGLVVDAVTHLHPVTVPLFGIMAAWRLTFLIVGIPGLLFALLAMTLREPVRRNLLKRERGEPVRLKFSEIVAQLRIRWTSLLGVSVILIFSNAIFFAFTAWAPAFFARIHGWTPGHTGRALGLVVIAFGCAGMYAGGALCNRWIRQGSEIAPLKVAFIGALGAGAFMPLAFLMPTAAGTAVLCAPALFFTGFPVGSLFGSAQLLFPNQMRGIVGALVLFILNLGGQTLGPLGPGLLNDHVFHSEKMIGSSIALTTGLSSILMILSTWLTFSSYRRHYRILHGAADPYSSASAPSATH